MFQWTRSKHNFFISTILLWQHLNSPSSWWLRLNASIPITLQPYKVKPLWLVYEITVSVGLNHRTFHLKLNNYLTIILVYLLPFLFSTLCYRNLHLFSVFTLLHWNLSQATMSSLWILPNYSPEGPGYSYSCLLREEGEQPTEEIHQHKWQQPWRACLKQIFCALINASLGSCGTA